MCVAGPRALGYLVALSLLLSSASAYACPFCHAGPDGGCSDQCTCCAGKKSKSSNNTITAADLPAPEDGVVDIAIFHFKFTPQDVSVTPGTTIRWTNLDDAVHNTVSDDDLWESEFLGTGESFEYTTTDQSFQTFTYTCTLHAGMFGSITVVAPEPASVAIFAGLTLVWPGARSNRRRSRVVTEQPFKLPASPPRGLSRL